MVGHELKIIMILVILVVIKLVMVMVILCRYRQMLFSCSKASLAPLSAVILHNETLYQKNDQVGILTPRIRDSSSVTEKTG